MEGSKAGGDAHPLATTIAVDDHNSEITSKTAVKELVAKSPWVDSDGRFYVGSRQTKAAALDKKTGDILLILSDGKEENMGHQLSSLRGREVVWIGRVDYSLSIYDTKTGSVEVQYSTSDFLNEIVPEANHDLLPALRACANSNNELSASSTTSESTTIRTDADIDNDFHSGTSNSAAAAGMETSISISNIPFPSLVVTSDGSVAYRNSDTGSVEWVANHCFESPSAASNSLHRPHSIDMGSNVRINRGTHESNVHRHKTTQLTTPEIEWENQAQQQQQQQQQHNSKSAVAIPAGQLFSVPLRSGFIDSYQESSNHRKPYHQGRRQRPFSTESTHAVATRSENCDYQPCLSYKSSSSQHFADSTANVDYNNYDHLDNMDSIGGDALGLPMYDVANDANDDASLLPMHYHPDHGYIPNGRLQQDVPYQPPQQQRAPKYNKTLRILGSWLPPTIALIFVVSFEMGRRKRQKDNQKQETNTTPTSTKPNQEHLEGANQNKENNIILSNSLEQRQAIQVSDQVLGYGGHGTVVFRGSLEGRNVAVKRMLKTYLASADREISLLIESDGHPNVVRYFLKEVKGDFVYLALELCAFSLHDLIGALGAWLQGTSKPQSLVDHCNAPVTKMILQQIVSGVKHLHSLRIVHRDLKPANILLAVSKQLQSSGATPETIFQRGDFVAKISDMGLGKQLIGQSSFGGSTMAEPSSRGQSNGGTTTSIGPGSVGWQAPEVMALRIASTDSAGNSEVSFSGDCSPVEKQPISKSSRISRSVDIFSLGCIFHSTLIPGSHPFGEWYEREANIMHNRPNLEALKSISVEAYELVAAMLQRDPRNRPTATQICDHPYFWSAQKRMSFLCDLSDRLEVDATSTENSQESSSVFVSNPLAIEKNAVQVVGTAWDKVLDSDLLVQVQRYRSYDPCSVRDILRLIRNKHHHYDELPLEVRRKIGSNIDGLMEYFAAKFPKLLYHCFDICRKLLPPDEPLAQKYSITRVGGMRRGFSTQSTLETTSLSSCVDKIVSISQKEQEEPVEENSFFAEDTISRTVVQPIVDQEEVNSSSPIKDPTEEEQTCEEKGEFPPVDEQARSIETPATSKDEAETYGFAVVSSWDEESVSLIEENEHKIQENEAIDLIIWEGSTAAKEYNCRGWFRSDDEWARKTSVRKLNANLVQCSKDPRFRTRLCNHWDTSLGTFCPMRKKNKCIFAHGPAELRVKDGKRGRWGKLVDKKGNNSNLKSSGGEDTYGAARSIENVRKVEGKWNTDRKSQQKGKKQSNRKGSQ